MSRQRVWLLQAVIALLVGGSLYHIVADKEHWPFSNYPMYLTVEQWDSSEQLQLFGVVREEPHQEIPLRDIRYLHPFHRSRIHAAFTWILIKTEGNPEKRQQMLSEGLRDRLRRYEELRMAGRHDGPPLRGIRLYQSRWRLDARAQNVDRPDERWLLAEVRRP